MPKLSSVWAVAAVAACAFVGPLLLGSGQAQAACHPLTFHDEEPGGGGVCCFVDHFHYGTSSGGLDSKAQALKQALSAWADLVYLEYGSTYDKWDNARNKDISCSHDAGWSCTVSARPCRRG